MNPDTVKRLREQGLDDLAQRVERSQCLLCGEPVHPGQFTDPLAREEFEWGEVCQTCQDWLPDALAQLKEERFRAIVREEGGDDAAIGAMMAMLSGCGGDLDENQGRWFIRAWLRAFPHHRRRVP